MAYASASPEDCVRRFLRSAYWLGSIWSGANSVLMSSNDMVYLHVVGRTGSVARRCFGRQSAAPSVALKALFADRPVDVFEKRLDVLAAFGDFVVDHERVLPYVHHQERAETRQR